MARNAQIEKGEGAKTTARGRFAARIIEQGNLLPAAKGILKKMPAKSATRVITGSLLESTRPAPDGGPRLKAITGSDGERAIAYTIWDLLEEGKPLRAKEVWEEAGLEEGRVKRIARMFVQGRRTRDRETGTVDGISIATRKNMKMETVFGFADKAEIVFGLGGDARGRFEKAMREQLASAVREGDDGETVMAAHAYGIYSEVLDSERELGVRICSGDAAVGQFNAIAAGMWIEVLEEVEFLFAEAFVLLSKYGLHENRGEEVREGMETFLYRLAMRENLWERTLGSAAKLELLPFMGEVLEGMIEGEIEESRVFTREYLQGDFNKGVEAAETCRIIAQLAGLEEARLAISHHEGGSEKTREGWKRVYELTLLGTRNRDLGKANAYKQGEAAHAAFSAGMETEAKEAAGLYLESCRRQGQWAEGVEFAKKIRRNEEAREIAEVGAEEEIRKGKPEAAKKLLEMVGEDAGTRIDALKSIIEMQKMAERSIKGEE